MALLTICIDKISMSENYSVGVEIGRGAYGHAYKAIDKRDKQTYVLKKVKIVCECDGFLMMVILVR